MASSLIDETFNTDKLSYEIFSILESKFLFSDSPTATPHKLPTSGKVCILSIDAASDRAILAALSLSRLEVLIKKQSGDPSACIADYFDAVAGSGAGGLLAAMLFTRGRDGFPLFTAEESLKFLSRRKIQTETVSSSNGIFRKIFRCKTDSDNKKFKTLFSDMTLRDTIKPVLISCYDMMTGSPFMFSRSDAVESEEYDFLMRDVCAAACANRATDVKSVDMRTRITAVGGARVGMGNPTAAAITHVLNNKREFPFANEPDDLLVVSLGNSEAGNFTGSVKLSEKIAMTAATDMVDQSVAMAFGQNSSSNYVRIQANGMKKADTQCQVSAAKTVLSERYIESVMFHGKKITEQTNGEKIDWVSSKLIREQERRRKSRVPTVLIKPVVATPRTSSATTVTVTSSTTTTTVSSC